MSPKKKKLYIILGVSSAVLAIGVLIWSQMSTPAVEMAPVASSQADTQEVKPKPAASGIVEDYPVPKVFPSSANFASDILKSSNFTTLNSYTPLELGEGDLGREDIFKGY